MNATGIQPLDIAHWPALLHEIPQPPKQLWLQGALPDRQLKLLAIVGSRKYSTYGKEVIDHLVGGLKNHPIGIISGLALGVDALAHEAALRHNLYTLAVPGSGLLPEVIYPAANRRLAQKIIDAGGGLLSEYEPNTQAARWTFPQRNRIMAGMCHATLLIEAGEKSGTLITARMAADYNRELFVVPGNIFHKNSYGVHQFLKLGATPITRAEDILDGLQIEVTKLDEAKPRPALTPTETIVINLLHEPTDRDSLIRALGLPAHEGAMILMHMELRGLIVSNGNLFRTNYEVI
jgi:DNA processing protein